MENIIHTKVAKISCYERIKESYTQSTHYYYNYIL